MPKITNPLKPGGSVPQSTAREVPFNADAYLRFSDALRRLHLRIRQETEPVDFTASVLDEAVIPLSEGLPRSLWQLLLWDILSCGEDHAERERVLAEEDQLVLRREPESDTWSVLTGGGHSILASNPSATGRTTDEFLFNCWVALELGLQPSALDDSLRDFPGVVLGSQRWRSNCAWALGTARQLNRLCSRLVGQEPFSSLVKTSDMAQREARSTGKYTWLDGAVLEFGPGHPRGPWTAVLFEGTVNRPRRRESTELLRWLRRAERVQLDVHSDRHGRESVLLVDERPDAEPRIMGEIPRGASTLTSGDMEPRLLEWCLFELGVSPESLDRLLGSFPTPVGEEVPPALLNPHYFDTDPDDTGRKYLPGEEYGWRDRNRREAFRRLLRELTSAFDLTFDEYDWSTDEASEGYDIPLSQLRDVVELIKSLGFDYEANEDPYGDYCGEADDDEETKLWVHDPVVMKLIPEGYNCYTLRAPE